MKITLPKTNLRKTAAGSVIQTVDKDTVWPMTGTATTSKGYTWYPINVNGTLGYVRGDCSFKLSATQEESYLAGNGVPDENNGSGGGTAHCVHVPDYGAGQGESAGFALQGCQRAL